MALLGWGYRCDVSSDPGPASSENGARSEYDRFRDLTRKLIKVPKREIVREDQREKDAKARDKRA
jgi:hypothetical protein